MIFRLSQKLAKKLGEMPTRTVPLDPNPLADWSGHLFSADRTRCVILTNTASLYSAVFFGRGVTDGGGLLDRGLAAIRDVMVDDGLGFIYMRLVTATSASDTFSKSLNRSVTGSIGDLITIAKIWLTEEELSPYDASFKSNETPMSAIGYANPREALKALMAHHDGSTDVFLPPRLQHGPRQGNCIEPGEDRFVGMGLRCSLRTTCGLLFQPTSRRVFCRFE